MAVLLTPPFLQFNDENGAPLALGKVYTYVAGGGTTPKATYTDQTEGTQATNPVILDAAGRATIWINGSYRFDVYDAANNLIKTTDRVTSFGASASSVPIAAAGGTVDVITADFTPDLTLADKTVCIVTSSGANTSTTPTFSPDALTAHTIVKNGGSVLAAGDTGAVGHPMMLEYNLANTRWNLMNPAVTAGTQQLVLIATGTASASATLDFTTGITGSYSQYIFVISNLKNATNTQGLVCQTSVDAGANWNTANYTSGMIWIDSGATVTAFAGAATSYIGMMPSSNYQDNATSGLNLNGTVTWNGLGGLHYHSCSFNMQDYKDATGVHAETVGHGSDNNSSATAVNGIRFKYTSGNITSGTIYMYGVKNT